MKLNEGFQLLATAPDGVARLRELILSLAVQGRLVPQDSRDEPATTLLQRVRHEKDSLIAEGQVKRDKPMQPLGHVDAPFAVPVGWVWTRFGVVIMDSEAGWSPSCENVPRTAGQWGVLKVSAVSWGKFRPEENKGLPGELVPRPEYEVRCGDFLLSRANTEELVARSVIVETDEPALMMSDKIIRLRLSALCDPQYFNLFNNGEEARRHYIKHASGTSSSMKNVSRDVILNLPIPLPPAAEQARIVSKVDELMRLCDELEARGRLEAEHHTRLTATLFDALAASESSHELAENWARVAAHFDLLLDRPEAVGALEQIILHLAVRGMLVPQDPTDDSVDSLLKQVRTRKEELVAEGKAKRDKSMPAIEEQETPFALPAGWKWIRLGQLLSKLGAGSTPLGGKDVYVGRGVKFLRSQNVWNEGLRLEGVAFITPETNARMAGTVVLPEDVLFNITGASIGRCAVVPGDFDEANVSQHVAIVRPLIHDITSYLHLVLISPHVQQTVMDVQVGVSREGLSMSKLGQFVIPLPPLAEQSRIVARVKELRGLCASLRERLTAGQTCQARFAEALVEQAESTAPLAVHTGDLAAAA